MARELKEANFYKYKNSDFDLNTEKFTKKRKMNMATKKDAVKKKPVAKKAAVAKVEVKITVFEQKVLDQSKILFKDQYAVILQCEGRNITVKKPEDVIDFVRNYDVINLYGTKSGCPIKTVHIR